MTTLVRKRKPDRIEPAYVKGYEDHGLVYFTSHVSNAVGAQCKKCNTIVWTNGRDNHVLGQKKPANIPDSGEYYRKYYYSKIISFLNSLPPCPNCQSNDYDLFINNVNYPRFADGTAFPEDTTNLELINIDPNTIDIWWLDEEP